MSKKPAQIKIITVPENQTNWNPGDEVNGIVVVYPELDAGIHSLSIELVYQRRGSLDGHNKTLEKRTIATDEQWEAGGEYPYKFKITLPSYESSIMKMGSYKGSNVSYYFNLVAKVDFDAKTDKTIRTQSIKKLDIARSFFPEKGTSVTKELIVFPKKDLLRVIHGETVLNPMKSSMAKWWFFVLPFLSLGLSIMIKSFLPFAIVTSIILAYILILFIFLKNNIGHVTAHIFESDDETFSIKYDFAKGLNAVKEMSTYVEITERVVDRRGTSDTTRTTAIYTSKTQKIKDWMSSIEVTYDLPKDKPFPIILGDVSLSWQTVLEMKVQFFSLIKIKIPLRFIEKVLDEVDDSINDE